MTDLIAIILFAMPLSLVAFWNVTGAFGKALTSVPLVAGLIVQTGSQAAGGAFDQKEGFISLAHASAANSIQTTVLQSESAVEQTQFEQTYAQLRKDSAVSANAPSTSPSLHSDSMLREEKATTRYWLPERLDLELPQNAVAQEETASEGNGNRENSYSPPERFSFNAQVDRDDPTVVDPAYDLSMLGDERTPNANYVSYTKEWRRKFAFDGSFSVPKKLSFDVKGSFQDSFTPSTLSLAPFRTTNSFDYEEAAKGDVSFDLSVLDDRLSYRAGYGWSETQYGDAVRSDEEAEAFSFFGEDEQYKGRAYWHHVEAEPLRWSTGSLKTEFGQAGVSRNFRAVSLFGKPIHLRQGERSQMGATLKQDDVKLKVQSRSEDNRFRKNDTLTGKVSYKDFSASYVESESLLRSISLFSIRNDERDSPFRRRSFYRNLEVDFPVASQFLDETQLADKNFLQSLLPDTVTAWVSKGHSAPLLDEFSQAEVDDSIGAFIFWSANRWDTTIGFLRSNTRSVDDSIDGVAQANWSFDFSQSLRGEKWSLGASFSIGTFEYIEIGNQFDDRFLNARFQAEVTPEKWPHAKLMARFGRSVTEFIDYNERFDDADVEVSIDLDFSHLVYDNPSDAKHLSLFARSEIGQSPYVYGRATGDEEHVFGLKFERPL